MKKLLGSVVMMVAFVSFASAETKIDAAKIVGKWEVAKSDGEAPKGAVVEFTKDGKLAITMDLNGKKVELGGTYKVDGDKLKVKVSFMGMESPEETDTIKSLKDDEFVTIDKDKKETVFKKKK